MGCRVRWNPSAGDTWEAFRLSCEYCQYVGGSPDSCQYLTRNILLVLALNRPSCPESRKWLGEAGHASWSSGGYPGGRPLSSSMVVVVLNDHFGIYAGITNDGNRPVGEGPRSCGPTQG